MNRPPVTPQARGSPSPANIPSTSIQRPSLQPLNQPTVSSPSISSTGVPNKNVTPIPEKPAVMKPMNQPTPFGDAILGSMPHGITPTYMTRALDKDITLPTEFHIPESELFHKLLHFESQVDFMLKKTQLKLQAALPSSSSRKNTLSRILRFTVSNTHEGQASVMTTDGEVATTATPASWSIRLSGRLLDEHGRIATGVGVRKMSSFFKSIIVQLDKKEFPTQWNMAWHRQKTTDDVDTFTFTRKSTKESMAHIFLHLNDITPEKFVLSPQLRKVLNLPLTNYTRTSVIVALWNYIRTHKLQDPERRSNVICDDPLRNLFDADSFEYDDIPDLIHHHLYPPEPIQIAYKIQFCNDPSESEVTYDIPVEIENPQAQINLNSQQPQIAQIDKTILDHIDRINTKKRKREFYLEFANDPLNFMDDWLTSQIRDYKIISNPANPDADFETQTEYYLQPLAVNAVKKYCYNIETRYPQDMQYN